MVKNKGSRFGDLKFKAAYSPNERKQNIRIERRVKDVIPLLLFSFKDFDNNQCPPGQTFKEWENTGLLADLMTKLMELSTKTRIKACQEKSIEIYGAFPPNSDFHIPKYIEGDVEWGTIQDVGGQKHRVAGYVIGNVFYIVFLDKDHKFWKMGK